MNNNEQIGRALDCLKRGLEPCVKKKMSTAFGAHWEKIVNGGIANGDIHFDVQALLDIMKKYWSPVFRPSLGHHRYGLIKEVRAVRNRWAHQEPFSFDEVIRALEAIHQLLMIVGARAEAEQVEQINPMSKVRCGSVPVVTTWEQIQQNILRLEGYRRSQEKQEVNFYKNLFKRGICFVAYKRGEEFLLGPSRYIGYVNNDLHKHQANTDKDGRVTNPAIDQILGSSATTNEILEKEYFRLCARLGITAKAVGTFGVARRYWVKY
jgi:hypothetical protein